MTAANNGVAEEVEAISNVLDAWRKPLSSDLSRFHKINLIGIVTYIAAPRPISTYRQLLTTVTIVDRSCGYNDKLKFNVFSDPNDDVQMGSVCEVGDILRFHRVKVQDYKGQPQAVLHNFSSWARFKRLGTPPALAAVVGNRPNVVVTPQDEQIVSIPKG